MSKKKKFEENLADLEAIVKSGRSGDVANNLKKLLRIQKGMGVSKGETWINRENLGQGHARQIVLKRIWHETRRRKRSKWANVRSFYEMKIIAPVVESVLYSIQAGGKPAPLLLLELLNLGGNDGLTFKWRSFDPHEALASRWSACHGQWWLPSGRLTNHKKSEKTWRF